MCSRAVVNVMFFPNMYVWFLSFYMMVGEVMI